MGNQILEVVAILFGGGSVGYLLFDRFVRNKEQRGSDVAEMMNKISDVFSKTLDTTMQYSQNVIDEMKANDAHNKERYHELEARYERLERRLDEKDEDNDLLRTVVSKATDCKYLKEGHNNDCPVIKENQKRISARCKTCGAKKPVKPKTDAA